MSVGILLLCGITASSSADSLPCGFSITESSAERDEVVFVRVRSRGHLVLWRDNRALDGGRVYLTLMDSTSQIAASWPDDGLRLDNSGRLPTNLTISGLGVNSAVMVWGADVGGDRGYDAFAATLTESVPGTFTPLDVTVDTVTDRPGTQIPVAVVSKDQAHGLVVIHDRVGKARVLVKQVTVPGADPGGWPADGVLLADEDNLYPSGLAAVASCSDDSLGCFVLAAGRTPIDSFHAKVAFHLFRLLPDGTRDPRWPQMGRVLTTEGDEFNVRNELMPDGKGGAYVAWTTGNHSPAGRVRVMLQRVDREGAIHIGWATEGIVAVPSDDALFQWYPRVAGDARERIVVALESDDGSIRLKAVSGDGTTYPGWPESGVVVGDITGSPVSGSARVLATDASGLVAAWAESRTDPGAPPVMIATVMNWAGMPFSGWQMSGKPLCNNSSGQYLWGLDSGSLDSFALVWSQGPTEVRLGRFGIRDGELDIGAQARHVGFSIEGKRITTRWVGNGPAGVCLYGLRRVDANEWVARDSVHRAGSNQFVFIDELPAVMSNIEYRLGFVVEGEVQGFSDTLRVGANAGTSGLRLQMSKVQTGHSLWMFLSVEANGAEAVSLKAFDVGGRCIATQELGVLSSGTYPVELRLPHARQGVVLVRASRGSDSSVARAALLR